MESNDIESESDKTGQFEERGGIQEIYIEDQDDDVHVCRKCNIVFYDIQKYLEHKVKHDNFKVKYCKSDVDKRMIMPKLVHRQIPVRVKKELVLSDENCRQNHVSEQSGRQEEEKENDLQKKKGKRGRRKLDEVHTSDLVITERPVYICSKCDRKFNREASLKRHMEYDHKEDSDDDDDDDDVNEEIDDDKDHEYKPNLQAVKEELAEDEEAEREMQEEAHTETMDTLHQVIMAAELVEQAEAQGQVQGTEQLREDGQDPVEGQTRTDGRAPVVKQIHILLQDQTTQIGTQTGKAGEQILVVAPNQRRPAVPIRLDRVNKKKFVCSVCNNRFKDLAVLKAHMLTHSSKRQFKCTYDGCTYAFKTKGSLKRHMRRHTGERPYPCELCGRSFAESGALTRHLKSRTPCTTKTDEDLPRYRKKWAPGMNIPAAVAGTAIQQENEANQPMPVVNSENILQEVSVISVQSLEQSEHVQDEHLTEVLQAALENGQFISDPSEGVEVVISDGVEAFTADDTIQQFVHSETVSQTSSIVCKVCNEECLSVKGLKVHLRTHLAEETYKCQQCHFLTESKEDFENHMFVHHNVQIKNSDMLSVEVSGGDDHNEASQSETDPIGEAQVALGQLLELPQDDDMAETNLEITDSVMFKCPVCAKPFRSSSYLKLHMRNHTGLRPHKCLKCSRSFITRDTLKKHTATHVEDRNFKCGECNKLFKRLSHVREHIKIHSGIRPFPCSLCEKSFKTNNAMKVHLRTHTDIMPYQCANCHRRFREKGSVIRHMRYHTGERPYQCRHCGKCFAEHGTLNRHLKAKVSCKKPRVVGKSLTDEEDTDYTVLAEFSSVVANTQQYIVPEGEEAPEPDETHAEDVTLKTAEIVVVPLQGDEAHSDDGKHNIQIQDIEVVEGTEALQVTDDYLVITDPEQGVMRVLDSTTGETVALVPMSNLEESQVQTITMSEEGVVSAVAMAASNNAGEEEEMITVQQLIENGEILGTAAEDSGKSITGAVENGESEEEEEEEAGHQAITIQLIQAVPRDIMEADTIENM